jgi:hypothetical protein
MHRKPPTIGHDADKGDTSAQAGPVHEIRGSLQGRENRIHTLATHVASSTSVYKNGRVRLQHTAALPGNAARIDQGLCQPLQVAPAKAAALVGRGMAQQLLCLLPLMPQEQET